MTEKAAGSHPSGTAVVCDQASRVLRVVSDGLGIFQSGEREDLVSIVDDGTLHKLTDFLERVQKQKSSMGWELNTITSEGVKALYYFGVRHDDGLLVVISPMPENLVHLYDQMVSIVNEQSVRLRECQQQLSRERDAPDDPAQLDSMMQLNNELVNAQRELSIRNRLLNRQKERAAKLFEMNPDALLVIDATGTVITGNSAAMRLFETDAEGLSGVRMKFSLEQDEGVETCVRTAEGTRVMEIRSTETEWDTKPATLVSLRDVTQRKELDELKDDVARISRHDLKSPLCGLVSMSQLLQIHEDPEVREQGTFMEAAGHRVLGMINDSLDLHRMERGEYIPDICDVKLEPVVQQVVGENGALQQYKQLDVHVDARCESIPGEESLYRTMLTNLLKNAFEAAPAGSTVSVKWQRCEDGFRLEIHNLGVVPKAVRHSFFDKYATAEKKGGSGLGTYSARLIAKALGGALDMHTSQNEGTTLTFSLQA